MGHVEENYKAFMEQLPELLAAHRGKFALMHDRKIIDFYDTARDAMVAGNRLYPGGSFSIQEVTDSSVDLGFFSHAMPQRQI